MLPRCPPTTSRPLSGKYFCYCTLDHRMDGVTLNVHMQRRPITCPANMFLRTVSYANLANSQTGACGTCACVLTEMLLAGGTQTAWMWLALQGRDRLCLHECALPDVHQQPGCHWLLHFWCVPAMPRCDLIS